MGTVFKAEHVHKEAANRHQSAKELRLALVEAEGLMTGRVVVARLSDGDIDNIFRASAHTRCSRRL